MIGMRVAAAACIGLLVGQNPPTARPDDALPPGAVFRIGSSAWRHDGASFAPSWSRDGKRLAIVSRYREVRILDGDTGKILLAFRPKDETGNDLPQCISAIFAPDADELAVQSNTQVVVYDARTGAHKKTYATVLKGPDGIVDRLKYSPDGRYMAVTGSLSCAIVDRYSGELVAQERTTGQVQGMAFSPDSASLATAYKSSLVLFDLAHGTFSRCWPTERENLRGLAISPNGNWIAGCCEEVIVFDSKTGKIVRQLQSDEPSDWFIEAIFTPDGKQLIAASQRGPLSVWNTSDRSRKWAFQLDSKSFSFRGLALRPDGKRVAAADGRNRVWVWDLDTGRRLDAGQPAHDATIMAVAFSPDGNVLATGSEGLDTHLWDTKTGRHLRKLEASSRTLAFADGGKRLISGGFTTPCLQVFDLPKSELVSRWGTENDQGPGVVAQSPSSKLVVLQHVLAPRGYRVVQLSYPSLDIISELPREVYLRNGGCVSRDGNLLAASAHYGIDLWDLNEGKFLTELPAQNFVVENLLFTPDGRFLIGSCSDKIIRMWELASLQVVRTLEGHKDRQIVLTLSPDGRVLASGGWALNMPDALAEARQIRLWNLATGKQVAALTGHDADVSSLAFSPDGMQLASGFWDSTALMWNVPPAARRLNLEPSALSAEDAARLWDQLASADAKLAQEAVTRLAKDPAAAVRVATQKLKPSQPLAAPEFQRLLQQLDSDSFEERKTAIERLEAYGSVIESQLEAALKESDSLEVRLRCGELLKQAQSRYPLPTAQLMETRAVQLLEWIADERAVALLKQLTSGVPQAHLTREAKAALGRCTS
jgi:WD40 repeat protein